MATTNVNGRNITVKQEGDAVIIPQRVPLEDIYEAIGREITSQNEDVKIAATIPAFSYKDAAFQLHKALDRVFGFVAAKQNMFGGTDNSSLQVEVAPGVFEQVAWGKFEVPGVRGWLKTDFEQDAFGHWNLQVTGVVRRKNEQQVLKAISLATELVKSESIYKGRALDVRLKDDGGHVLAEPDIRFVKTDSTLRSRVIFGNITQQSVDVNLYAPIEFPDAARKRGIPLKRGVLLEGPYGTGKTLSMEVAAALAVANGWTYVKARLADDLAELMRLSTTYLGATVLTCEDVDQVLNGERDIDMNTLLNTIDTTDKSVALIVALSTNHADKINKAMLRAGRLDAIIHVAPPDADATERLMRQYGNGQIDATEDISEAAALMAHNNAGDIREVVERAKLAEMRRNPEGEPEPISGADLLLTGQLMQDELTLRKPLVDDERSEQVKAAQVVADAIATVPSTSEVAAAVAHTLVAQPE